MRERKTAGFHSRSLDKKLGFTGMKRYLKKKKRENDRWYGLATEHWVCSLGWGTAVFFTFAISYCSRKMLRTWIMIFNEDKQRWHKLRCCDIGFKKKKIWVFTFLLSVGYHLPFQHNELFHLPYMAVAEISLWRISLRVRQEEPFLLLKYILTLSLILCSCY